MKDNGIISMKEKIYIVSKIYDSINIYFSGWQLVPDLNIDQVYKETINEIIDVKDRYQFGLCMMKFIANIKNGCSKYCDKYITEQFGSPLGFKFSYYDGKWIIRNSNSSYIPECEPISKINDQSFERFFQEQKQYISAFSEREARNRLSSNPWLFPDSFELTFENDKKITINRKFLNIKNDKALPQGRWLKEGEIAYLRIPSFENTKVEKIAIQCVEQFKDAKTMIIDIRDNEGGIIPEDLIKCLMERPYRFWSESTSINLGLFKCYGNLLDDYGAKMSEKQKNYLSLSKSFKQASLIWPASYENPENPIFKGRICILVNGNCNSSAEDFIIPFKDNKRATIIGEKTMGSTGMPYVYNFGNGVSISIGTKRPYFPDGSSFDGVGIAPDIGIHPNLSELKSDKDTILQEAIKMVGMLGR